MRGWPEIKLHLDVFYEAIRQRREFMRIPQTEKETQFYKYVQTNKFIQMNDYEFFWELILEDAEKLFSKYSQLAFSNEWRGKNALNSYFYLKNVYLQLKAIE